MAATQQVDQKTIIIDKLLDTMIYKVLGARIEPTGGIAVSLQLCLSPEAVELARAYNTKDGFITTEVTKDCLGELIVRDHGALQQGSYDDMFETRCTRTVLPDPAPCSGTADHSPK